MMEVFLLPVLTGIVILYLCRTKRLKKAVCLCLLAGTAAAAASLAAECRDGPRQRITELPEDAGGLLNEPVLLTVETEDGKTEEVAIRIPEKALSQKEIQDILAQQAAQLDGMILGKNASFDHIEWDLSLPASLMDGTISVSWSSSCPEVLNWNGIIGREADAGGTEVVLNALLAMEEETLSVERILTVYPSQETEALADRLQEKTERLNEQRNGGAYRLPEELDGEKIVWYRENERTGQKLCLLILAAALMAAVSVRKKEEERQIRRREELLRSYPEVISKSHLLLAAGLSLRKVFERLASDYRRERKRTGKETAVGEELLRTWYDMENGMLEQDAFTQFGERCGIPEYKAFALLLAQNQTRGGRRLPQLLEAEVQQAFENRKRQARIAGEKAAVRLAMPMGMMLVVVLIVVLVPALLSF